MQLVQDVPTWMFLRWLPQMIAFLPNSRLKESLMATLVRIAGDFPQAVLWPIM